MVDDYQIGVYDVVLDLNVSDESLVEACETDAPTRVMVVDMHLDTGRGSADPHRNPECRLCELVESFAARELDTDADKIVSYTD